MCKVTTTIVCGVLTSTLAGCGGGGTAIPSGTPGPVSYTSFTNSSKTSGTSVTVLRGQGATAANTNIATYNHQTETIGALSTTDDLTAGYSYVKRVVADGASEQLAIISTIASDLPPGTVVYTGAPGSSAIQVIDGSNTGRKIYDDPAASATITVQFSGVPNAEAVIAISDATVTNHAGGTDPSVSGTVTISNLPMSGGAFTGSGGTVTFSGLGSSNLNGATVNTVGGLAGPQGAEIGAVITSTDLDTQMTVIMTGKKP